MSGTNPVGDLLGKIDGLLSDLGSSAEAAAGEVAGAAKGAGLFGRLGGLFGGSVGQLFVWEVLGTVLSSLMAPGLELLRQGMFEAFPILPLSPADLSTAVVRNFIPQDQAAGEARKSGIDAGRFQTLVDVTGLSLSPQELATALRRGLFDDGRINPKGLTFEDGIRQGDLKDQWGPFVQALATYWPSPVDMLRATLQGQVPGSSQAEQMAAGRALYERVGGDPQFFELLFNTEGSAPTPDQAALMARRGIIPWTGRGPGVVSYEQAFLEGPWRDKWSDAYRQVSEYIPPPRTIMAMLRAGAITEAEASKLLAQSGMHPDLIAATLAEASSGKTATHKEITVSQALDMFASGYLAEDVTRGLIEASGYSAKDADLLLAYKQVQQSMKQATFTIDKIRSLFVGRKISAETARGALAGVGVPAVRVEGILADWETAQAANVKTLTQAEITEAFHLQFLDQATATAELMNIGYTALDSWTLLSIKEKKALPDKPAQGPGQLT